MCGDEMTQCHSRRHTFSFLDIMKKGLVYNHNIYWETL